MIVQELRVHAAIRKWRNGGANYRERVSIDFEISEIAIVSVR